MHVTKFTSLLVLSLALGTFGAPVPTIPPRADQATTTRLSFFETPEQRDAGKRVPLSPTTILANIDPATPGGTKNARPEFVAAMDGAKEGLYQPIPKHPKSAILTREPRIHASTTRSASAHTHGRPELEPSSLPLTSAPKSRPSSTSTQFEVDPEASCSSPLRTPLRFSRSSTSTQFEEGGSVASKSRSSSTGTQFEGGPGAPSFSPLHTPPRPASSQSSTSTQFEEGSSVAWGPSSTGTQFESGPGPSPFSPLHTPLRPVSAHSSTSTQFGGGSSVSPVSSLRTPFQSRPSSAGTQFEL